MLLKIISIIKYIIPNLIAGFGIWIAYSGLNTWKKQHVWDVNYKAFYAILTAIFQVRKAIHYVRNNRISHYEYPLEKNNSNADSMEYVFKNRFEKLSLAYNKLDAAKLECQVLWGVEFEKCIYPLEELISELQYQINTYLDLMKKNDESKEVNELNPELLECKRIIFHVKVLDMRHGSFGDRLHRIIRSIEKTTRENFMTNTGKNTNKTQ